LEDVLILPLVDPDNIGEVDRVTGSGGEEGLKKLEGGDDTELRHDDEELVNRPWVSIGKADSRGGLVGEGREGGKAGRSEAGTKPTTSF